MYEENLQNDAAVDDDDSSMCECEQLQQRRQRGAGVCASGVGFSKLLKEKPVHHLSYSQNYGKGYFALYSDPMMGNYKTDYYVVCFSVYNAPADDMYDGRYEIEQIDGSVWGWKEQWQPEYKKNELSTWDNNQPVKGAWVEIRTLDKGDEYGKKTFRVKLHVDEMTEKNGDYARNINISFTGRDTGPMLVN